MNEKTLLEIRPFAGVSRVTFGMQASAVGKELGEADSTTKNHLGQLVESRSFANFGYSVSSEELAHIGLGRQMENVFLGSTNIFMDPAQNVLSDLTLLDDSPYIYLGYVVFLKLGISLTGFHDGDIDQKAISLFPKGAWDKRIPRMNKLKQGDI
ncbi:hypothetical protein DM872_22090 [Pseudomonas taiwanensis]|uniref:hypothetical protein n=1 Tax=Pseudomonas taiwanensis TaxID=470150 RepID=UPI0015BA043A|nr:hypothetical protein [Pseudomonas taiwanensis]NWL79546.1 hypothetical protein [Pseudomonas taiwanensis]